MDQPKVFLYALSTCGHCKNAKKLLDANGVKYDFIDVDLLPKDEMSKVLDDVRKVNPQAAFPTLLINDKVIIGYRELEILEALGL
jgi:glutaredoxin-like protein NrdH